MGAGLSVLTMRNRYFLYRRLCTLLLLAATLVVPSCSHDNCPLRAGDPITQDRDLPPFTSITLDAKVNLVLTQDTVQHVRISAGKNLADGIKTTVDGQTLSIKENNPCLLSDPSEWSTVYISSPRLQTLTYYGSGNVTSTNTLQASVFTVDCWTGVAKINLSVHAGQVNALVRNESVTVTLTGAADSAYIYCGEAGSVDLTGMPTTAAGIDSKSVRDIYVDASHAVHANITYSGNVYYKGNPSVLDAFIVGSGRLIHLP